MATTPATATDQAAIRARLDAIAVSACFGALGLAGDAEGMREVLAEAEAIREALGESSQ